MEIIGTGFLARHLRILEDRFPDVTALAAGVSGVAHATEDGCQREASLLYDVLRRCRRDGRLLVFFSTASVYGAVNAPAREADALYPMSAYPRHKLALEQVVRMSGVRHLILRVSSPVGPHQPGHQLVASLASQVRSGSVTVWHGAARDLIDVGDLVSIVAELIGSGVCDETINVASGVAVPIEQVVDELESVFGVAAQRHYVGTASAHLVSIEKLLRLAPAAGRLGFGPDYHRGLLRRALGEPAPV